MAKEVLEQRYHEACEFAKMDWEIERYTPIPFTMEDIIAEAAQLSKFVNQKY